MRRAELLHGSVVGQRKLTTKQRLFIAEFMTDLNATKAAERAGYSRRTARQQGARMLTNVDISAEISDLQRDRFRRLEITADRVLRELALLGFANMMDYIRIGADRTARVDLSGISREEAAAIGEITVEEFIGRQHEREDGDPSERVRRVKIKLHDKRAALVDLGRHLKLFTERVQVDGDLQLEVRDVKQKLLAKLMAARQ